MSNNLPIAISIVLPVYNGGEYLKLSVESVLKQDFIQFEFLILDDCSSDGSYEYLQGIKDDRIVLYKNKTNRGLFYNLNFLISQSKSPLIKLWAQDDIMYPICLSRFVHFHAKNPQIGFSYSGRSIIDEKGNIKKSDQIDTTPEIISTKLHARIAYFTGSIAGNIANVCLSKKALDRVGTFNENMKISADFEMWVRMAEHYETGFINENLIMLRDHSGQLSRNEKLYINHVKEDLEVYRYLDNYVTVIQKKAGHKLMRNNKMVFYYTLMIKAFIRKDFTTAKNYLKLISSYQKIIPVTIAFIKVKFRNKKYAEDLMIKR